MVHHRALQRWGCRSTVTCLEQQLEQSDSRKQEAEAAAARAQQQSEMRVAELNEQASLLKRRVDELEATVQTQSINLEERLSQVCS
jgi:TolA-binding protein